MASFTRSAKRCSEEKVPVPPDELSIVPGEKERKMNEVCPSDSL